MVACPSISETILGLTFLDSSRVAHVCRRSWNRVSGGSPALRRSLANERLRRLDGLMMSLKPKFWLRYPRFESGKAVEEVQKMVEDAVPRILTPPELAAFLKDANEQELITICKENSWAL